MLAVGGTDRTADLSDTPYCTMWCSATKANGKEKEGKDACGYGVCLIMHDQEAFQEEAEDSLPKESSERFL